MKFFAYAFIAAAVAFTVGCTPKLANRELGPEEKEWKEYLESMYPGWEMPGTLPPAVSDNYVKNNKTDTDNADDGFGLQNDTVKDAAVSSADTAETDKSLAAVSSEPEINKVRHDEYTVEKDDSLSLIAKKVYGNGKKYYRILKANEDVIKNQDRIYPGMKLRIPRP